MILIDALYICRGGGLVLLKYLVKELISNKYHFLLLCDARTKSVFDYVENHIYLHASLKNRYKFYRQHKNDFTKILCFGNIPAPIKLKVPVYTYFHNINLLKIESIYLKRRRMLAWFKRSLIRYLRKNTDKWIVQTDNTKNELISHFCEKPDRVLVIPFFDIPDVEIDKSIERNDYFFPGGYNFGFKGHNELIDAWKILKEKGICPTLHLTVEKENTVFIQKIENLIMYGVHIVNHGVIPFSKMIELYCSSKAVIYPSRNESLGLGLIEGIKYGCDIISSDLPFTYSVCEPSVVFDPSSSYSIANAVKLYEKGTAPKSVLKISNDIDKLVNILK